VGGRRYGYTAPGPPDAVLRDFQPVGGTSDERSGGSEVTVTLDGTDIVLRVAVPGEHMALNAAAALVAGLELGAPRDGLLGGLADFGGVRRRFEFKGRSGKVRVYDDYAHNPTKVAAQLKATRLVMGQDSHLVVVFQPHLYSRTRDFAAEFGRSLGLADEVVVLDVFGAREEPIPGVTGRLVADAVDLPGHVHYEPGFDRVPELVAGLVSDGDLVLTMGAGDVTMLGPEVIAALDRRVG
jgi:UDP-N-acetylmuramate--alanine ligase